MRASTAAGKICVTGATGLIGRQACAWLEALGCRMLPVSRTGKNGCDLLVPGEAEVFLKHEKPEILVHLAWHTGADYAQSRRNMAWLDAGIGLVRSFFSAGGRRFVGIGTCFEYMPSRGNLSEKTAAAWPGTLYGQCKLALMEYLRASAAASDLSWAWCRLFYLVGPGDTAPHRLVPAVCAALGHGKTFTVREPETELDFIDTRDAGEAIGRIALSGYNGIINVGTGNGLKVGRLTRCLARFMGREKYLRMGANGKQARMVADCSILRDEIGFVPRHNISETLREVVEG